jgi:DNA-binding CsgD family transcriptional regulator
VPALSGTERRVLALRRAGRDVREIAQELFLTPGAVQTVLDGASAASPEPAR